MTIQASLSRAVDEFYSLVDAGEPRHRAAVKVASGNSLLPDQIDRLCQTLNRAAVDTRRRSDSGLADRLANPGVLDPQMVRSDVFTRKSAGYSDQLAKMARIVDGMEAAEAAQLAEIQKTAAAPAALEDEPAAVSSGIWGLYAELSPMEVQTTKLAFMREINQRRKAAMDAERDAVITVTATENWLRKHPAKGELLKQAAFYAAEREPELLPVIAYLGRQLGIAADKTAAAPLAWHEHLLAKGGAIETLRKCVAASKEASAALAEHFPKIVENRMRLSLLINTAADRVPKTAVVPSGSYAEQQEGEIQKVAAVASSFMGSMLGSQTGHAPKPSLQQDPTVQAFTLQLRNPQHEATLRSIRARAALQSLLAGDEVLQAYEPSKVVDAFNELSQHTPAATEDRALLRATLRQMLQNNISVYDLQQFRSAERKK